MEERQKQKEDIRVARAALEKQMVPEIMRRIQELQMQVQKLQKQAEECMDEVNQLMMYLRIYFPDSQPPQQQQPQP